MSKTHCPGCGAPFQSEQPGEPGFLPPEAAPRENPICRRCYKLKHYGKLESAGRGVRRIHDVVRKTGREVELAVLVVDLFDLEGSLRQDWTDILSGPVVLALNKVDLLPRKTPVKEVVEAAGQICRERLPSLNLKEVIALSAQTRLGLEQLLEQMILRRGSRHRIGFFGVTNTGKSSLLANFLAANQMAPTISSKPGTTQGSTSWYVPNHDLTLIDTPGWSPGTRLTDKLCPDCSGRLVVKSGVPSKFLELDPGSVVMLGAFASLENIGDTPALIAVYSAEEVNIHPTNPVKAAELLEAPPAWLAAPCESCRQTLTWKTADFEAPHGNDIFVSGLGWFAIRKNGARLRLKTLSGLETGIRRPTLFGGKST